MCNFFLMKFNENSIFVRKVFKSVIRNVQEETFVKEKTQRIFVENYCFNYQAILGVKEKQVLNTYP